MTETIDVQHQSDPSPSTEGDQYEFHKPGPNKRVCAFLIDSVVLTTIMMGFSSVLSGYQFLLVNCLYLFVRDSFRGHGLGKLLVGLQVIDDEERTQTPLKGILRNLTMITMPFQLIEYVVMLRNNDGRRLGDRLANTWVTDTKPHIRDSVFLWISIAIILFHVLFMMPALTGGGGQCPLRNAPKPVGESAVSSR